jgi:hypothetical protein
MRRQARQRGSPSIPDMASGDNIRCPQTEHTQPAMGCMQARHSSETGSREIVTSGAPQMRQSEGNNTAKRLSPARPPHRETIERPATALAWIARVRSPLLLKTASRVPVELAVHGRRISLQYNGDADR